MNKKIIKKYKKLQTTYNDDTNTNRQQTAVTESLEVNLRNIYTYKQNKNVYSVGRITAVRIRERKRVRKRNS